MRLIKIEIVFDFEIVIYFEVEDCEWYWIVFEVEFETEIENEIKVRNVIAIGFGFEVNV